MSVTHVLPELPETAPTNKFVQSNKVPSIKAEEYEHTETYLTRVEEENTTLTTSPGDVIHRNPGENTEMTDTVISDWPTGETWWYVTAVTPNQLIVYDLIDGIFRPRHKEKLYKDVAHNDYEYTVYS